MPYLRTNLENIINIKKNVIFIIQPYAVPKKTSFMGESHDFWEFMYVTDGKVGVCCDEKKYIASKNDILFFKPNMYHHPFPVEPYPLTQFINISFECSSAAMRYFENYHGELSPKTKQLLQDVIEEGKQNFSAVAEGPIARSVTKQNAPLGGHQLYRLKLELFLITLLQEIQAQTSNKIFTSKNEYYRSLFTEVTSYLSENIYSDISMDDICKKFNYGKSFLSKLFKDKAGVSIMHYYKNLKIKEAKILLRYKEHSVAYTAEVLGFGNRYNFSKVFKQYTGFTPAEYKNQIHPSDLKHTN